MLRNRWRRRRLADDLRDGVCPKKILLIGPTGVGKSEISRRLAKLANAPFRKVEATKFTEVGYVGRDIDQIVRDLFEIATYRHLRNLDAMLLVMDGRELPLVTGGGDVLAPDGGVAAIGSGADFALAAGCALEDTELDAEATARRAMAVEVEICVYTNDRRTVEVIGAGWSDGITR